jgi:decaprenylphospho-beta-D-erythro-pentofuranosid-2-ulose 2-reductase
MSTLLVLGATSDIGFAIAKKFATKKYDLQLAARNVEQLKPFQTDLQIRFGINCSVHKFDAANFETHHAFYDALSPKPDVTVYVVGYLNDNEKFINDWDETLKAVNANYVGAVSILNIIAGEYSTRHSGTIVGISSVAGNRGRQSNYIYGSSKAGFTVYLSGLRNKLFPHNVHVLTVLPGFVYTKMTEHLTLPKLLTATSEQVAESVYNGVANKRNILYVKWFWKWIMLIITAIPEPIFKKKKL